MEMKQIIMLTILLGAGLFGSIGLVYGMLHLDSDEEKAKNDEHSDGGNH